MKDILENKINISLVWRKRLHTSGIMSATDFSAQNSAISNRITKLRSDRKKKLAEAENDEINILKELDETIADYVPNGKFDEELFENIVKFGKAQSAKEGKVAFNYKYFLGYKKGEDGNPEIDENEAETIRYIYNRFLAGDSLQSICKGLENQKMLTPYGKEKWTSGTVQSILTNEKYKGDAVINKTYVVDCISKKVKINDGDRPKYYVENNHPAIIDSVTFGRVQEELAKRSGKKRVKFKGVKTEQGKYSSKYALTEMLIMRRVQNSVSKMYVDCPWREEDRMAVRETVGLRKEVLPFADDRRRCVAGGNRKRCSKGRGGRRRDDTNLKISYRQSIYLFEISCLT